jgi:hypothetical protein
MTLHYPESTSESRVYNLGSFAIKMYFTTSIMAASTKLNNIYVLRSALSCLLLFWHLQKKETACLLKIL